VQTRLFRRNIDVGVGVAVYNYAHFALSPVKMRCGSALFFQHSKFTTPFWACQ
jgi:hypothetical protein